MKTTYKAITKFQGHEPGEEFEADLDADLERRAKERGQIKPVKKEEEDKKDG
jgi:hypothetical protein